MTTVGRDEISGRAATVINPVSILMADWVWPNCGFCHKISMPVGVDILISKTESAILRGIRLFFIRYPAKIGD